MDNQTMQIITGQHSPLRAAPQKLLLNEFDAPCINETNDKADYLNLIFTLLIWFLIASLHSLAFYKDALRHHTNVNIFRDLASILPGYVVLLALSCGFARVFSKKADHLLKLKNMLFTSGLTVLLGVPILTMISLLMNALINHRDLTTLPAMLNKHSAIIYCVDAGLLLFAYLMQAAYAFWHKGQIQSLAFTQQNNESLALRLRLLQGQLKPHFLFNALNSISALVRTADRELASSALEKLSALLRYVVHSSKHEWLSVADEINFTKAYLDMQMLRYGERTSINWHLANVPWEKLSCPPLLFQPLVENAIHHGVEQNHEICHIQINLRQKGDMLEFRITSPVFKQGCSKKGHGLGLSASRDRLAILYGQRASLTTEASTDRYTATLEFPLGFLQTA
ncbi:sensor histidine kinase [Undibacterium sp. Di27W]|uniref:sensor histidine kinase n=1 Tax=Undibacterium sp. Di27W TaxID=3413036 RepID=UPI003BF2274E